MAGSAMPIYRNFVVKIDRLPYRSHGHSCDHVTNTNTKAVRSASFEGTIVLYNRYKTIG